LLLKTNSNLHEDTIYQVLSILYLLNLKYIKDFKLGEYDWSAYKGDISIIKLHNKRIVSLLSNFQNPEYLRVVKRNSKNGSL